MKYEWSRYSASIVWHKAGGARPAPSRNSPNFFPDTKSNFFDFELISFIVWRFVVDVLYVPPVEFDSMETGYCVAFVQND